MNPAEIRALIILIFIVSLLAENCNFDTLRKENPSVFIPINSLTFLTGYNLELTSDLNNVSQVILTQLFLKVYLTQFTLGLNH